MCVAAHMSLSCVGVRGLALVWHELVQELRYRWENGVQLRE